MVAALEHEALRLVPQPLFPRPERGLAVGDRLRAGLERMFEALRALLELLLLRGERLLELPKRGLAGLDTAAFACGLGLDLTCRVLTVRRCCVALTDRALARGEPRFGFLLPRLVRGALALELALALADLRQLLRQLSGRLGAVALCGLELLDAALCMSRKLLDTCVLGDNLGVALDERRLLALEIGDTPGQRLLLLTELAGPVLELGLALRDRAGTRMQLVAGGPLALECLLQFRTQVLEFRDRALDDHVDHGRCGVLGGLLGLRDGDDLGRGIPVLLALELRP